MCTPGCGGTGKAQLIRALSKYFLVTERIQKMRKLAPTGIAATEIGGMIIHSFLGEHRNSGKPRPIRVGDWRNSIGSYAPPNILIHKHHSVESMLFSLATIYNIGRCTIYHCTPMSPNSREIRPQSCQTTKKFNNASHDRSSSKSTV